jgi:hypothetical protein
LKEIRKKNIESGMEARPEEERKVHRRITGQIKDHGRTKDLTRGESRIVFGACWALRFDV